MFIKGDEAMYFAIALLIIIFIAIIVNKDKDYKKLSNDFKNLEKKLNEMQKLSSTQNITLNDDKSENLFNNVTHLAEEPLENLQNQLDGEQLIFTHQPAEKIQNQFENTQQATMPQHKKVRNENEKKNILILLTGSICIVLAAIVFLMSTWTSIPNILKTTVLALVTLVFLGGSYIAKEKFKLDKVSQTFFYIAMAYIPICLASISIFELFGNYLSIYGEGKYLYMLFATLFMSSLYYVISIRKESKYLLIGSLLSQVLSVISFSLILSNDVAIIYICLLLYNILLMVLTKQEIFKKLYTAIPTVIAVLALFVLYKHETSVAFLTLLIAINFLALEFKKSHIFYSYMFNVAWTIFGVYSIFMFSDTLTTDVMLLLVLCFTALSYIAENLIFRNFESKNLVSSSFMTTLITLVFLHIASFFITSIITPYIVSALIVVLLAITYNRFEMFEKKLSAILIPLYFIATFLNILNELNCSSHFYIIFAFLTFALTELLFRKETPLRLSSFITSHIFMAFTLLFNATMVWDTVIYLILLLCVYAYCVLTEKGIYFKYLGYVTFNFALGAIANLCNLNDFIAYVPMISTLLIMALEHFYPKFKDDFSTIYLGISQVVSYAFVTVNSTHSNAEVAMITTLVFSSIAVLNFKDADVLLNAIPLAGAIPVLFFANTDIAFKITMMLLTVALTTALSIKEKKMSIFTVFSFIYLIIAAIKIENLYFTEIAIIAWSALHYLTFDNNTHKDIAKFLVYLFTMFLYNSIMSDLELTDYTALSMLGYILLAIFTIKTILVKYHKNVDILEYITFGLLYVIAFFKYSNEVDGMLFVGLLIAIVVISYIKKYGVLFIVTILAILANVFMLTRQFWFSVPWWIYLSVIGAIFIAFAIKNEANEKKREIKVLDFFKNIKEKIEK